ncbi:hypothetical protein [Enterococcus italicus]|uniref:hypothetical protein n=1 Tax=Enterococcus italicus TaxID=246144 RepID=UPI0035E4283B
MIKKIIINHSEKLIELPDTCPHCGEKGNPTICNYAYKDDSNKFFGVLLSCPHNECRKFFALEYNDDGHYSDTRKYENYSYRPPIKVDLPDNIEKVSEAFVEIYSQATKAESEKLDQIAGVGYRKSLEFLIKDYAIRKYSEDEEKIKKIFLGPVISQYLNDFPKLQNLAQAATWIGNDETHYVRRHDDKDIRDMKQFIKSASQFIAADYDADVAEEFINE